MKRSEDELLRTLSEKSRGHPRVCFRDPSLHYVPLWMTKNGCFNFCGERSTLQRYKIEKRKSSISGYIFQENAIGKSIFWNIKNIRWNREDDAFWGLRRYSVLSIQWVPLSLCLCKENSIFIYIIIYINITFLTFLFAFGDTHWVLSTEYLVAE